MNNKDRIRLAEVMGGPVWEAYINPDKHPECVELPNPATDANDDCAVLLFARKEWRGETKGILWKDRNRWLKFKLALTARHLSWQDGAGYEVGDYAKAALKVIDQTPHGMTNDGDDVNAQ